ncbi:MAG: TetR/AcrR family transcriptional regulator [Eubacterium sp.]|nr:TetR/AcrR family transcriptional regulator [Eubacterium sp.]
MGKVEANKQAKRTSLLQTAYELFVDKGFNSTTISDISKKSGLAKGTFYLYFHDKYDLRDQLIARKSAQILEEAQRVVSMRHPEYRTFEEMIIGIADYILNYLAGNKMLLKFINKNLSWGLFRHAIEHSEEDGEVTLGEFYQAYLKALNDNGLICEQPELMLFTIIELIGSTGFSCILYESPVNLGTYMPYLHKSIHQIIEGFTEKKQQA